MADTKISALPASTTPLAGTEVLPIVQSGATVKVSVANLTDGRTVAAQNQVLGGITLSAWAAPFDSIMQMKYSAITGSGVSDARWFTNSYYDGAYKYVANGFASRYEQSSGGHYWLTAANNTGGANAPCSFTQVAQLIANGNLTLDTGNLVIGTSGKGIDFSATTSGSGTMTSELLSDYEEGTWTPVLTPNTSGTITITSPTNSLNYTKIGRLVTLTGRIVITSVSVPLGLLILSGFPFTSGGTASNNSGAGAIYSDNMTTALALSFRIAENVSSGIIATPNQGDAAPIMQAGTTLYINIAYAV